MGGMQLLQFCSTFPDKAFSAIPIDCSSSHSAQNIALNELARQAIMADPVWDKGKYFLKNVHGKNWLWLSCVLLQWCRSLAITMVICVPAGSLICSCAKPSPGLFMSLHGP